MSRFAVVDVLPSEERAIINLDAITIVTVVNEPGGTKKLKIHMADGSAVVVSADSSTADCLAFFVAPIVTSHGRVVARAVPPEWVRIRLPGCSSAR
jgi:hypothetical protein